MDIITHAQLRGLAEAGTSLCVSMFLPTHRPGRDTRQDPVHLKNLIREAEEKLVEVKKMRGTEARDLLEPAKALLDNNEFWNSSDSGIALFIAPGFFRMYRLPIEVDGICHVNDRFEIKPLLPLLEGKLFYVLALSLNDARLLECSPIGCHTVKLPQDVALSLNDAVQGAVEHQTHLMRHASFTSTPNGAGSYHGQAVDLQGMELENKMFFFRQLDEGVRRVMCDLEAPVVLAGVDSVTPLYRRASSIRNIVEESIEGNAEHVSNEQIHSQALPMVETVWQRELLKLQDQFGTAYSHKLASNEIEEILPAAASGRVGILFVSPRATYYGKFDNENLAVTPAGEDDPEAEDLIDRATMHAIMTGAQVVVVEPEQVPGQRELGAIYRY